MVEVQQTEIEVPTWEDFAALTQAVKDLDARVKALEDSAGGAGSGVTALTDRVTALETTRQSALKAMQGAAKSGNPSSAS